MANMCCLPLDIGINIIDILACDEADANMKSVKACALVLRSFLPLCRKYIFKYIAINKPYSHSPTIQRVEELFALNSDLAQYVHKLDLCVKEDDFAYPGLPSTLKRFTRIKSLVLWYHALDKLDWQRIPPHVHQALLHLLHLPSLTFLKLRNIQNFAIADLVPCSGLTHLNIEMLDISDVHGRCAGDSEPSDLSMMVVVPPAPIRVHEYAFGINGASSTAKLVQAKRLDGLRVFDFMDLKKFSGECDGRADLLAVQDVLRGIEGLVAIHLKVSEVLNLRGFARTIASSTQSLKSASFAIYINDATEDPLVGLCEELEAMRGTNVLQTLAIRIMVLPDADCKRGQEWGKFDEVLGRPGWRALRSVSLQVTIWNFMRINADAMKVSLEMLLDTQFLGLSSNKEVDFSFGVQVKEI